jgi:WD40 repeat protein
MLKCFIPLACAIVVATGWASPVAEGAEAVPEASAIKVIDLAPADSAEKTPVISSVALHPSGKLLAAVGDDHLVRIIDPQSGNVLYCWRSHTDWVKASAFRPDGQVLATSGADRRIHIWDMSGQDHSRDLPERLQAVYALTYSRNGQMLAAAGFDDQVGIYNAVDGRLLCEQPAPGKDIRALCFSPDGAQLAAAGRLGLVRLWDVRRCEQTANVQVSSRRICAMAYSPDGKLLAVGGQQRVIRLLDTTSGKPVIDLPERPGEVLALCFCGPNLLASAGSGNVIHLWDLSARQERCRLVGHTGSITTLAFHREKATLISGSYDTTVRLWNVNSADREKVTQRGSSARAN